MKRLSLIIASLVIISTLLFLGPSTSCSGTTPMKSCKDLLLFGGIVKDGTYTIDPDGADGEILPVEVYCDMTTDGGGWTLASVCRLEGNPNYPAYYGSVPNSPCWNTAQVGTPIDPNSSTSAKLDDTVIVSLLTNGERTSRGHWKQQYRYNASSPTDHLIYNQFSNPAEWSSAGCGTQNKEFYIKGAYEADWGVAVYSTSTGCSCAVNGWSNSQKDSCGNLGTWFASCEKSPSASHCCACQTYDERADLVVWVR